MMTEITEQELVDARQIGEMFSCDSKAFEKSVNAARIVANARYGLWL